MSSIDIWKALAGIAIFLLGIKFLEESLKQLAGRKFKLFLKKQTSNKLKAIGGGAIVTAVLQSSSIVNLMVLAFVGAGIITMQNALAIVLGANLGTTVTNWLIALLGFKFNIENFALPITGIAGIAYALINKHTKWFNLSRFFLGFSFMFVGLSYIKTGIEGLVKNVDLQQFEQSPAIVFLLIGLIITALIQSSSATVAITLSALFAGAISLFAATAIVLGSEIGTTLKLFIASINGNAAKRRVALASFIFNTIPVLLVLILLAPVNNFITTTIGIKDKLIALVFFQTLLNIIGIILFYPFLNLVAKYLGKIFVSDEETLFIHKVPATEPTLAIEAVENEARHFLFAVFDFAMSCFENKNHLTNEMKLSEKFTGYNIPEKYEHIKYLHGEIHSFYITLQNEMHQGDDFEKLDRLMSSVRNCMYAAKNFKDALPDIKQLRNSSNDIKFSFYTTSKNRVNDFFEMNVRLVLENPHPVPDELTPVYKNVTEGYNTTLKQLYGSSTAGHVNETEISTLLNFNREIYTAFKSLFFGLKEFLLDKNQSRHFDELPGFIR